MAPPPRPPFSELPLDKNGPPGNAWGLYGPDDELGALNMITPSVVKAAAQEIQTGDRVSLDWYLNLPSHPSFTRPSFSWKMKPFLYPDGTKRAINDDHVDFNTQGSSQWDGFRHYGYQKAKKFYGGRSQEELETSDVIGLDRIVNSGGITTRGVILDYPRYLEKKGEKEVYSMEGNSISADVLKDMMKEAGVQPRDGDLLLLRTGFTRDYYKLSAEEQKALRDRTPDYLGVRSDRKSLQWLWESGFAAVASDAVSFEMAPIAGPHTAPGGVWANEPWEQEMQGGGLLHQWMIGGWGVMIGEMFDLEALCEKSAELNRSTCFVSSVPLKVPGGVASPPNAVAIF
ncbi:hypothetical protein ACJBU6_11079 [Exserohilum turcicum]